MKSKKIPVFNTIEEESDYWDNNDLSEYHTEDVTNDFFASLQKKEKKPVSMRLDTDLVKDLKTTAKKYKIPYQRLTQQLLRLGIQKIKSRPVHS